MMPGSAQVDHYSGLLVHRRFASIETRLTDEVACDQTVEGDLKHRQQTVKRGVL